MTALHVTNGDSAATMLRTFLSDPVMVTCDVLHDGPAPRVPDDEWYDVRAKFLTEGFDAEQEPTRASLAAFDRALAAAGYQETVLWFEHDLYDQLLLIRTLDVMARVSRPVRGADGTRRASLICIGEFPGVDRFIGLGQLNGEQLASLYPTRVPITSAHYAAARDAWHAFRADEPRELFDIMVRLSSDTTGDDARRALPFLADAIRRFLEEYPSTTNGLSRSASAVLRALEAGPLGGVALFQATQAGEARPFLGDLGLFTITKQLAAWRTPLVTIVPDAPSVDLRGHRIELTNAGRDVLHGRADAIALGGIDEWRGGVHLEGAERSPWRWDPERQTLVS